MSSKKKKIKEFVTSCTFVFKSFDYEVIESKNKANLWHFTAIKDAKKYVIYCAPDLSKVKGIIKVALKKVPNKTRLVVICTNHDDDEYQEAQDCNYALITLTKIKNYGDSMLEAQQK